MKGAFTPGCSEKHLPTYIRNISALKEKGVDVIAVIAFNDPHVMAAWGKANSIKGDDILFLSDPKCKFSQSYGWTNDDRLARYAFVIDKGTIAYAAKDNPGEVIVSFLLVSSFWPISLPNIRPIWWFGPHCRGSPFPSRLPGAASILANDCARKLGIRR